MVKFLIPIALVSSMLLSCKQNASQTRENPAEKRSTIFVSPFHPLLTGIDHTSEGVLAPLNNGKIMLIFRVDPGQEGDHVGTNSYIAQMQYDPQKDEWNKVEKIYDDPQYDDRNIHGGVTRDGTIVFFFRKYDGNNTVKRHFMFSKDNGKTWSEPQISEAWSDTTDSQFSGVWSTGQMFYNPDIDKYAMLGCRRYITYSSDGTSWEEYNLITDNQDYALSEIAGAWCGKNRIIALIRDDRREHGHPLVQVESHDNGQTWSEPVPSNIPPKQHWGCAPQMIYNQNHDLLIALTSDRYSRPDKENSMFIYTAQPDKVMGQPKNWQLQHEMQRPWAELGYEGNRPVNQNLYGYPTIAPINEDEYLVVFTERAEMKDTEQADLYYFRIRID